MVKARLKPGDEIDGFVIEGIAHNGGMARIWTVSRPDIECPILMKVPVLGEGDDPAAIVGFEMEQMILPRLSGPHVPRFIANGDFATLPYIVMERLPGASLYPLLERLPHGLRPLTRLSYFLDAQLYGMHPPGFLSTNLLLHAITVLLVFALARRRLDDTAALAAALRRIARRTATTKLALVHGDISPKNIMLGPQGPVFLDAECAWYGDPAFDLAFCLNHLLLKCLWTPTAAAGFLTAFDALAASYMTQVAWEPRRALEARTASLLPGLSMVAIVLVVGVVARTLMDRLHLLLVPRVCILLCFVVLGIALFAVSGRTLQQGNLFGGVLLPIVILSMMIERFSVAMAEEGFRAAIVKLGWTTAIAVSVYPLFRSPLLQHLMFGFPELVFVVMGLLVFVGGYTGFRVTELFRFRALAASGAEEAP